MIEKVISTIKENRMISNGDKIIVALSGGPDSMSLLNVLYELRERFNLTLYAAHVNHMLRGEDSDNDEKACKTFCEKHNIKLFSKNINIDAISKERNISHEMAGREVRYEFFIELFENLKANKIALAHNSNDQAETVLMRLMRGSGIEGLVGIKPVRDSIFIRPLINTSRKEIEEYCSRNSLPVRIDKTNFESIYARNKVRLELIPYIEENFNTDIIATLNRMSSLIRMDSDYLEEKSSKFFEKYCDSKMEKVIIYKDAFNLHYSILSRVLRKALFKIKGNLYNLESIHIENIINIQKGETGKTTVVPGGVVVSNVYKDIHLHKAISGLKENKNFCKILSVGESIVTETNNKFKLNVIDKERFLKSESKDNIKYFDYDKIKQPISIRFRQEGDRFTSLGMKGSKKLKDLFMDLKIPREQRDEIPLICFGDEIGWIVGYRISDKFKVENHTKNILEIRCLEIPEIERQESYE
ncbi:tRNA lysidine(34) synthetase TilS [Clostridium sp.]|uniref:tRNA lysidine(34) synthetase TilS n=1 Tax=Clostridium sp. TaxID=1506 RepID=UPI002FC93525